MQEDLSLYEDEFEDYEDLETFTKISHKAKIVRADKQMAIKEKRRAKSEQRKAQEKELQSSLNK